MKIFYVWLILVTLCYHVCFAKEEPAEHHMEGDCVDGRGSITFYDGSRYAGQFRKGAPHGQGTMTFSDGSTYTGEFRIGEMNGQGIMRFSDGTEYVGEFKDGVLCGQGTITFPDGSAYEGQFEDDKYHGQGVWSSPYGIRYEGQFKDGKFDGHGIYSLPDGSRYIGFFKDDKFYGQGEWAGDNTEREKSDSSESMELKSAEREIETDLTAGAVLPSAEIEKEEEDGSSQHESGIAQASADTSDLAYSVQVGAFLSRRNAEKLKILLREKGYDARILPLDDCSKKPWYTVRLGSYISLKEAQEKAAAFSEKEKMATIVRPVNSL